MAIAEKKKVISIPFDPNDPSQFRAVYVEINGYVSKPQYPTVLEPLPVRMLIVDARKVWGQYSYESSSYPWYYDGPNLRAPHYAQATPWNERLYADAYARFVDAARDGSAEWALNLAEQKKTLSLYTQLCTTIGQAGTRINRQYADGLRFLKTVPHITPGRLTKDIRLTKRRLAAARTKVERRGLSNRLWLLDQAAGWFLAYRFGIAPLVKDLRETAHIMSREYPREGIALRKARRHDWSNRTTWAGVEEWSGKESVVLRATARCSNPNLLLANRMGLVNPASVVWETIPYSFVADWFLPFGQFISNFTAAVGLTFLNASVTRTRSFQGLMYNPEPKYVKWAGGQYTGKYKVRTVGSLPLPKSVPYGSGLGIERAKTAIALLSQQLTSGRKR